MLVWIFSFLWGLFSLHDDWNRDPAHNSSALLTASTQYSGPGQHILYPSPGSGTLSGMQTSPVSKPTEAVDLPHCALQPTVLLQRAWPSALSHATISRTLLWNHQLSHRQTQTFSSIILLAEFTQISAFPNNYPLTKELNRRHWGETAFLNSEAPFSALLELYLPECST